MSYQVLARKWRPAAFEQMVGQSHVLHALTNALSQQRLHHAYLFTGTRGVGKTSIARLFAKGLNCETGVTASPCGQCHSCIEIAEGRFVDLIEVDAASRTKVDDTRELLDNVQYRPTRGRFKVYLIDEVHMLSKSSFNALLKTLEEPPEHVKFLLATTDPQKLPITVLSRCLQFNLKSLSQDEISRQLQYVLTEEHIEFEPQALTLLAKSANGSMRDGLSLTDQAIAFGAGQVMHQQVQTMLGSVDERHVLALLESLLQGDIPPLLQKVAEVLSFGADAAEVLRSLLELLHQITLTQFAPSAAQMSLFEEQIQHFANTIAPEQVQLYYQILLTGKKELPHAPDPKSGLEMALLRVVAFRPQSAANQWSPQQVSSTRSDAVENKPVSERTNQPELSQRVKAVQSQQEQVGETEPQSIQETEEARDTDENEALIAEQEVILSQAQSQGFGHTSQAQVVEQEPLQAQEYVQVQSEFAAQEQHIVDPQGKPDGANPTIHSVDHGSNSVADTLAITPQAHQQPTETNELSLDATIQQPTLELGDDLLDAVLATREHLMSDLEQQDAKDGAAKKPTTDALSKSRNLGKKKQPVADSVPTNIEPAQSLSIDYERPASEAAHEDTQGASVVSGPVHNHEEHQSSTQSDSRLEPLAHVSSTESRPPWEAPHATADEQKITPSQSTTLIETASRETDHNSGIGASTGNGEAAHKNDIATGCSDTAAEIHGDPMDLHWYKLMGELDIGGRVRQLAVNSICRTLTMPLQLLLKPDQKHLAAELAIEQLTQALSTVLGEPCSLEIEVGLDGQRETPLEIRKRFHRELLGKTKSSLLNDEHVQWLMQQFTAQLEDDSLSYPPELLSLRSQSIHSLLPNGDKQN
ncbi:DNA polymerase III subunit gamma/tau [Shewanella gelidii]|uniref:DNA-directed DNA polymerase n=1 Tax=Shewanella gelidii TaxID=1642821 RepID=A0A917N850_9GAMM|nr:DNA polymerase III subunit gamma/tau [Shewanella gelidii]MCL1097523.1 DNA polymerase III subunit gamma/tau [Shewanella gelidii]GGI75921.1 DNA polymerase III subunit gamma/tau [Shewanella gelidii]